MLGFRILFALSKFKNFWKKFAFLQTEKVSRFIWSSIDLAVDSSDITFRSIFCGRNCCFIFAVFLILYNQSNFGAIANIFFIFLRFVFCTRWRFLIENYLVSMLKCISLIGLMIHAFAFGLAQADFQNFFIGLKWDAVHCDAVLSISSIWYLLLMSLKINDSSIPIQQQKSNQFLMAMVQAFMHFNGLFILKAI